MYVIMGQYQGQAPEEIDTADSKQSAIYLKNEYILAFGAGWRIWVKKVKKSSHF